MEYEDDFFCGHCLEITKATNYPDECQHCHVGYCVKCHMRLKHGSNWCIGCGIIKPEIKAHTYRTSSTSGFYANNEWNRQSLPKGQDFLYGICTHYPTAAEGGDIVITLYKSNPDYTNYQDVRRLTDEELIAIGYKKANG